MKLFGKEKANSFVILGHSPRVDNVLEKFLKGKTVIAVNQVPKIKKLVEYIDHWIVWDDHPNTFLETEVVCKRLSEDDNYYHIQPWIRLTERTREKFILDKHPLLEQINWYEDAGQHTAYKKNLRNEMDYLLLKLYCNVAEVATHLAYHLGAEEVILVGVDFIGDRREDGSKFYGGTPKSIETINESFKLLQKLVLVYKTMAESPLQMPLYGKERVYDL